LFHKGTRTTGGNLPLDLQQKIIALLDEFVEIITKESQRRKLGRAMVRSQLPCSLIIVVDKDNVWVAAQKQTGMPSTVCLDHRDKTFPIQEVINAARWEFGFDNPFVVGFPNAILDQQVSQREPVISAISNSHIESELQRVYAEMNTIQINPIFGPASYRIDERLAFVLMPFTDELTKIYHAFIKPTVELPQFNLVCKRADDIKSNRVIIQDIWKSICEARIVIADISELNPNVMYELGITHTLGKETVLIYQRSEKEIKFPFDLAHIRRIEYENSATGGQKLKEGLEKTLEHVLSPKLRA
jgi:hypothetical protein